jgi:hypothetical protein
MARIRSIKPEFCSSETIASLPHRTRLHFAMLWTFADDAGRGVDNPRLIKAALWPLDDDITPDEIATMQGELESRKLIGRYEVDGRRYFVVTNFGEHQHPSKPQPSKLPAPSEGVPSSFPDPSGNGSGTVAAVVVGEGKVGEEEGAGSRNGSGNTTDDRGARTAPPPPPPKQLSSRERTARLNAAVEVLLERLGKLQAAGRKDNGDQWLDATRGHLRREHRQQAHDELRTSPSLTAEALADLLVPPLTQTVDAARSGVERPDGHDCPDCGGSNLIWTGPNESRVCDHEALREAS